MIYKYSYISRIGKEEVGMFEGQKNHLLSLIEKNGWILISLRIDFKEHILSFLDRKKIDPKYFPAFFEEFRDMLNTGLPLNDIFESLRDTTDELSFKKTLNKMQTYVFNGNTLADSFNKTEMFPVFVISSIETGERAGRLSDVMDNLAEYYRNINQFKGKIVSQLSYPLFVGLVLLAVIFFIALYAIPSLGNLFPTQSSSPLSRAMIIFSTTLIHVWPYLLLLLLLSCFTLVYLKNKVPLRFAEFLYTIPLLGKILKEKDIAYFFLNLALLSRSGITVVDAVLILNRAKNSYVSYLFMECRKFILSGASFSGAIKRFSFFPSYTYYTVRKGEEVGLLPEYFNKIYLYYLNRVNTSLNALTATIQPVLLFTLAGILIFIALGFLMPIYSNLSNMTSISSPN